MSITHGLDALCAAAVNASASDLIVHENVPPLARVNGALYRLADDPPDPGVFEEIRSRCGARPDSLDHDGAFSLADGQRFRVSVFRRLGLSGAVLRVIRNDAPNLDALGLPPLLRDWVRRKSGIVLVTGPTGSGKSATLAAALESLNQQEARHIVTIEDPVEFVFENKSCVFTQREVGVDTPGFAEGLRSALRQSPDVLFVGEIRDSASASAAIHAAETGHLVLASVHGSEVTDAIERTIQLFPPDRATLLGRIFALQLIGVLAQRLAVGTSGARIPIVEFFTNVGATRKFIEEGRLGDLREFIRRADGSEARAFSADLVRMCEAGLLAETEALSQSPDPDDLRRALRGVRSLASRK